MKLFRDKKVTIEDVIKIVEQYKKDQELTEEQESKCKKELSNDKIEFFNYPECCNSSKNCRKDLSRDEIKFLKNVRDDESMGNNYLVDIDDCTEQRIKHLLKRHGFITSRLFDYVNGSHNDRYKIQITNRGERYLKFLDCNCDDI